MRGVICASLRWDGKTPWLNERFARWAMRDENVEEHALMSDVGMKSRLDDLGCKEWRSFETSAGVTGETVEKSSPEWIGSGSGGCKRSVSILDFMAILRLLILEMKKFKNVVEFIELLLPELLLRELGWRRLLTVFQRCLAPEHEFIDCVKCFFLESLMRKFARRQDAL